MKRAQEPGKVGDVVTRPLAWRAPPPACHIKTSIPTHSQSRMRYLTINDKTIIAILAGVKRSTVRGRADLTPWKPHLHSETCLMGTRDPPFIHSHDEVLQNEHDDITLSYFGV
jgi:hypothetical protein